MRVCTHQFVSYADPSIENLLFVVYPRLQHHPFCPIVCQPTIVHKSAQPDLDSVSASELLLAHQAMEAAIPITDYRDMLPDVVFFDPVYLKVTERPAVPATNDWERVLRSQSILEELLLMRQVTILTPEMRHSRIVHPLV